MSLQRSWSQRKVSVLRCIVEMYLETARPVGSRCVAMRLNFAVSPATIRTTMGILEDEGMLFSTHTSSGRVPTAAAMQSVLQGMSWSSSENESLYAPMEHHVTCTEKTAFEKLENLALLLSQFSQCMGVVWVQPDTKHRTIVNDVDLRWHRRPDRVSCAITLEDGSVVRRMKPVDHSVDQEDKANTLDILCSLLVGRPITEVHLASRIDFPYLTNRQHALWLWILESLEGVKSSEKLIIRGQSCLLTEIKALEELVRVQELLGFCEKQSTFTDVLRQVTLNEPSVKILIGSQDFIFHLEGCAVVLAPYETPHSSGVVGVAGLQRMDYRKLVPMVEYTANLVKRVLS